MGEKEANRKTGPRPTQWRRKRGEVDCDGDAIELPDQWLADASIQEEAGREAARNPQSAPSLGEPVKKTG